MAISRREALRLAGAALITAPFAGCSHPAARTPEAPLMRKAPISPSEGSHAEAMAAMPPSWMGKEQIAMVVYPGMTALDLVGPQYMLAGLMGAKVHLVAESLTPVMVDTGFAITPTISFEDCPVDLDLLLVPGGGEGTLVASQDERLLAFLRDRGAHAKLITSVCTGSLVLGAAGLLKGYQATSHWVVRDLLPHFGAIPVDARVVVDRNRLTAAGVSAGIDLGLMIVKRLRDEEYAKGMALLAEYAPEPPVDAGTPQKAGAATTMLISSMFTAYRDRFIAVGKRSRSS